MLGNLRRPLFGDFLASMFVGLSLFLGYDHLHHITWLPLLISFFIPFLVYCFSAFWNRCSCSKTRALITALVMGTFFVLVHHAPLPHWIIIAAGFVAPLIVSWWARRSARYCSVERPTISESQAILQSTTR